MATSDFTITFLVEQSPRDVFNAINHVRAWWTDNLEGDSQKMNDEFTVRFADAHVSTQKIVELVPNQKIVWLVTDSKLDFVEEKHEWTNTRISFELSRIDNKTQLRLTHFGLVPDVQCYQGCTKGWDYYINRSLFKLITEGKGTPGL